MIKSMTGYGRAQATVNSMNIIVEIKSVNHRYFEFSSKVPRNYGFLDEKLKNYIGSTIQRGKVECYVAVDDLEEGDIEVLVNHSLASAYINAMNEITNNNNLKLDNKDDTILSSVVKMNDVFTTVKKDVDEEKVWESVKTVLNDALNNFISMREAEGSKLRDDVLNRTSIILSKVEAIEKRSPVTVKEYNDKLLSRIKEFLSDVQLDEQRILTECAIFADKVAVAEETVRLRSHIDQLKEFMDSDCAIGRKIDFLVQEMNRESNTIGSKAQDVDIAKCVIDIKAEIEKIREQIQNIE